MSTMIQIRNVPEEIHREAKARAARQGVTLSEYALRALRESLARPTAAELASRVRSLTPVPEAPSAASIIHQERANR